MIIFTEQKISKMTSSAKVEIAVPNFCQLGEGPHWSLEEQCLYYIDIFGKKVCRYDPATKENKFIEVCNFSIDFLGRR
jgi:sugar lactone lactonase YvrE